jgi:hypothetical protein
VKDDAIDDDLDDGNSSSNRKKSQRLLELFDIYMKFLDSFNLYEFLIDK